MTRHPRHARKIAALGRLVPVAVAAAALSACGTMDRLADVGKEPDLTPISNPATSPDYVPVHMPMPAPRAPEVARPNSLWQPGSRAFFRDQRAGQVGDILTVLIEIDDEATIRNQTSRSREGSANAGLPNFLGFERKLVDALPEGADASSLIGMGSESASAGNGRITRGEEIELKLASVVTDTLPNGNLVIYGRQEVRVNFEVRELAIAGIIRPQDISSNNTISYEKIAEARISYGGRGQITDLQQPRYGQQVYDILFPF